MTGFCKQFFHFIKGFYKHAPIAKMTSVARSFAKKALLFCLWSGILYLL
jgi:hypothetical protein